jgi:hypothetical protein
MAQVFRLARTLLRVSGPEAQSFLNDLLTQDAPSEGARYGALLSPQGKLVADMTLWARADGIFIDTSPERGAELLRRLTMYKLRAHVDIADVSNAFDVLFSAAPFDGAVTDPRLPTGALGWRAIADAQANTDAGDDAYDAMRLAVGVPDLARDAAPEEVFALEALLEELNGVDFQKGCFVGQENVSRMKRRATTRRKFCAIEFAGAAPEFSAVICAGAAEIGSVRTGTRGRALALLRLDRAAEAIDAGTPLRVGETEIRLTAPDWLILPQREPD